MWFGTGRRAHRDAGETTGPDVGSALGHRDSRVDTGRGRAAGADGPVDDLLADGRGLIRERLTPENVAAGEMDLGERRRRLDEAVRSAAATGAPIDPATVADLEEYAAGRIDAVELVQRTRARHGLG